MLCRECRDYLSAYKRSIELSRELLRNPVTSDSDKASEELIQKVLADAKERGASIDEAELRAKSEELLNVAKAELMEGED